MSRIALPILSIGFCLILACKPASDSDKNQVYPTGFHLPMDALPAFEQQLNHAHFISQGSEEFYHKGMITYRSVCFNCHGNEEQPGTLPDALKFWADSLKAGSDPFTMYQTLTRGYGLMPPHPNLSPIEKYEVIHFIREEYMREQNPDQFFEVDSAYLTSLPVGDSLGPDPSPYQPWAAMDYGDFLMYTYELAEDGDPPRVISGGRSPLANEDYRNVNFAYKGIAIRLDEGEGGIAAGNAFVLFDHDLLRMVGFWTGEGFIDYEGILLNDVHNIYPRTVGQIQVENPITPGWANPASGNYNDPRFVAVDGRPFGPLPREWAHYKGLYYHDQKVVIHYTVGDGTVLESYALENLAPVPIISRNLEIKTATQALELRIAPDHYAISVQSDKSSLSQSDGYHILKIPAQSEDQIRVQLAGEEPEKWPSGDAPSLKTFTQGGPKHDPQTFSSPIIQGDLGAAYEVDVFALPQINPFNSRLRPTGIDFMDGGKTAVISTIDGEVWRLDGIDQQEGEITWHRIATGLFQPLGIKYHDGDIYVGCRDQICVLRDLNGDGETDYYESFNSDHQVTEHFHEFAMGLQTDSAGNFYYAKSARHARTSLIPQHGTLIKVDADGQSSRILANGFRAANGVCLNPDGSFIVTDQQGYWNPMNRINWVTEGGFYGNMFGYGAPEDSSDAAMVQPLCWIDMKYDRSPSELLWAHSDDWGPLSHKLLNLSYGYGKMFLVIPQQIGETRQGGMVEVPLPQFPTGIMRGRFNPMDGQFYGCGMSAWATNQMIQVGGIYRVRYTGRELNLPIDLKARSEGLEIHFSDPLDPTISTDISNYTVRCWDIRRTRSYGSKRYNERELVLSQVDISEDGKQVMLSIPNMKPSWIMEISYRLKSQSGIQFEGAIQNTVYKLEKATL